jgi:hypothetical protein
MTHLLDGDSYPDCFCRRSTRQLITLPAQHGRMPATLEVVCTADDCELDMFELHYTYDMSDEVGLADFQCPYCGGTECLSEVEL